MIRSLFLKKLHLLITPVRVLLFSFVIMLFCTVRYAQAQAPVTHPLNISTQYVNISAEDYSIEYQGETYYFDPQAVTYVTSAPYSQGTQNYTTIFFEWDYNNHHLGVSKTFHVVDGTWTQTHGYISIDGPSFDMQTPVEAAFGESFSAASLTETYTGSSDPTKIVTVTSTNVTIHPFIYKLAIPPTTTGYFIEMLPANSFDGQIRLSLNGTAGYAAILRDETGAIVTDQSQFTYRWSIDDPSIASISPQNWCAYSIDFRPICPEMQIGLSGVSQGSSTVRVHVSLNGIEVANGSIGIVIGPPVYYPSPTPTPNIDPCTLRPWDQRANFNNQGRVDISDYQMLFGEIFKTLPSYTADTDCDHDVDLDDYWVFWGELFK